MFAEIPPERRRLHPEAIVGFLTLVRETHGSVEDLLRTRGMTEVELGRLRDKLLER